MGLSDLHAFPTPSTQVTRIGPNDTNTDDYLDPHEYRHHTISTISTINTASQTINYPPRPPSDESLFSNPPTATANQSSEATTEEPWNPFYNGGNNLNNSYSSVKINFHAPNKKLPVFKRSIVNRFIKHNKINCWMSFLIILY